MDMSQAALDRVEAVLSAGRAKLDALKANFESDLNGLADNLEGALGLPLVKPLPKAEEEVRTDPPGEKLDEPVEGEDHNKSPIL